MSRYSRITGTGSFLPPKRVTNADMVALLAKDGLETSDEWIVERTGIRARHFAEANVTSSDLGAEAARRALEAAGISANQLDLIIVATSTPDMVFPSAACILQNKIGANGCPAFDVQAVCSGFVYALTMADSLIRTGTARRAYELADALRRSRPVYGMGGSGSSTLDYAERVCFAAERLQVRDFEILQCR